MVQTLARCRECGLPGRLAENLEWGPGGVITLRRAKPFRLVLTDERTVRQITAALAAMVGDEALLDAEAAAARAVVSDLMRGVKGKLSRYGAVKRKILEALEEYALLLGMGRIEMERFSPGEGGSMLLRRPFDLGITVAGITAVLGEMERCSYRGEVAGEGENDYRLLLHLEATRVGRENAPEYRAAQASPEAVEKRLETCGRCGLPAAIKGLRWDEVYGVINAGAGGRRVALLPAYVLASMERLAVSSGRGDALEEAVYAAAQGSLEDAAEDACQSLSVLAGGSGAEAAAEAIAVRGWGAVKGCELGGDEWCVEVANPVNGAFIAGWLRAIYTVAMGREPLVKVSADYPVSRFELVRANGA